MHNPVRPIARLATTGEVEEIRRVCSEGRRATYTGWQSEEFIEEVIGEFYVPDRVAQEVGPHGESWGGYVVAELDGQILVAGDGEVIEPTKRELFVLYADPARRRQGGGAAVFSFITAQQRELGAVEQWVSVKPGNETGLPFYRSQGFVEQERRPDRRIDRSTRRGCAAYRAEWRLVTATHNLLKLHARQVRSA